MKGNLAVLLLGIIYSCQIHIARSMQRQGIDSFEHLRHQIRGSRNKKTSSGSHIIYVLGILLSNLGVVYVVLAGKSGTISYFTAMYGVGMLPMLLYTRFVMKEHNSIQNWIGVLVIICGCVMMGFSAGRSQKVDMTEVKYLPLIIIIILTIILTPFFLKAGKKSGHLFRDAMFAGLTSGFIASLDPLLKSTGQNLGAAEGLFPDHLEGWLFFIMSFAASTIALLITQYAYTRRVKASQLMPFFNVGYVMMPVFVLMLIVPGYLPGKLESGGIIVIILGIIIFSEKDIKKTAGCIEPAVN